MKHLGMKCAALALAVAASAEAFTLTGKVVDESDKAIEKASVELLKEGLKTKTDSRGEWCSVVFAEHERTGSRADF